MLAASSAFQDRTIACAHGRALAVGPKGVLMAIINVTPDSFSDGGRFADPGETVACCLEAVGQGAGIIDIGGESTRPGAAAVSAAEEQDRVLPVIEALAGKTDALISIDTYRAETARLCVAAGAHIVNDVSGGTDEPEIFSVVAEHRAGYCLMHTSRGRVTDPDPVHDQIDFLARQVSLAEAAGIDRSQIMLDPGFGFGKDEAENLQIMAHLDALHALGLPLLIGTSRKRFVASVGGAENNLSRDFATAATTSLTRLAGGSIFRVHNVAGNRAALAFADAMIAIRQGERP